MLESGRDCHSQLTAVYSTLSPPQSIGEYRPHHRTTQGHSDASDLSTLSQPSRTLPLRAAGAQRRLLRPPQRKGAAPSRRIGCVPRRLRPRPRRLARLAPESQARAREDLKPPGENDLPFRLPNTGTPSTPFDGATHGCQSRLESHQHHRLCACTISFCSCVGATLNGGPRTSSTTGAVPLHCSTTSGAAWLSLNLLLGRRRHQHKPHVASPGLPHQHRHPPSRSFQNPSRRFRCVLYSLAELDQAETCRLRRVASPEDTVGRFDWEVGVHSDTEWSALVVTEPYTRRGNDVHEWAVSLEERDV